MRMLPIVFKWDEQTLTMTAEPRYANVAKRQFHHDESYPLVILEARSRASHNAYFASIQSGFDNLPETIAARWPTSEHLRHWLLVEAGWFDESEIDTASPAHAKQTSVLVRSFDEYARISVHGSKVIIRRAKSQSAAAMSKDAFEKSKRDVLDLLEHLTAVPKGALMKNAGRSA